MKRNHLTVARLRDLKLHAIRISGHLHVTGLSIHECLVVPTRTFWSAMARIAGIEEPDFGDEYPFFQRCRKLIGARRLDFTITVHVDKAQLLTDAHEHVKVSPDFGAEFGVDSGSEFRVESTPEFQPHVATPADTDRQLPWEEIFEAMLGERLPNLAPDGDEQTADQSWPLLEGYDPGQDSRRVWGWEELRSLPRGKFHQLLSGPDGTLRPSRN